MIKFSNITALLSKTIMASAVVITFFSCGNTQQVEAPKIVELFDTITEEAVTVTQYQDSTPRIVNYYAKSEKTGKKEVVGQVSYHSNHNEYMGGRLKEGKRDGQWKAYFPDGNVQSEGTYVDGKLDGPFRIFQENGHLKYVQYYSKGICTGIWKYYDEEGKLIKSVEVTEDTAMCGGCSKCRKIRNSQQK